MSNTIAIQEWLGFIDSEYLSTFVKDGGASVKFAVTPEERKPELYSSLSRRGAKSWITFSWNWTQSHKSCSYAPGHLSFRWPNR